jgi:hypothetical protein
MLFTTVQIGPRLQARVAAHLRLRHGGALPQPFVMEEGNWIEMTGILLITAGGIAAEGVAADDAEGRGAETGRDSNHGAEGLTGQGAEAAHDDMMERTALQRGTPPTRRKMPRGLNMPRSRLTPPRSPCCGR